MLKQTYDTRFRSASRIPVRIITQGINPVKMCLFLRQFLTQDTTHRLIEIIVSPFPLPVGLDSALQDHVFSVFLLCTSTPIPELQLSAASKVRVSLLLHDSV